MNEKKMFVLWSIIVLLIIGGWLIYEGDILSSLTKSEDLAENQNNGNEIKSESDILNDEIVDISDINLDIKGSKITIQGMVIEKNNHENGHLFLVIEDHTGKINIPIFANKKIKLDKIQLNSNYQITGKVDEYNNTIEIIPEREEDIVNVSGFYYDNDKIVEENIDKEVTVIGTILTKYDHPDGHVFLNINLDGIDKEISVPVFDNINYSGEELKTNAIITVKGKIDIYKDEIQVIPQKTEDIIIIEDSDEEKVEIIEINEITEKHRGKRYQVKGYVSELNEYDGHLYFTLSKDNSQINSVLFRADGEDIKGRRDKIKKASKENFPIRILATVDQYKGNSELVIDKVYNNY